MSLRRPTREIEYSSNGTDWTSVKDDVKSFSLELCDLIEGIWGWRLTLNNKGGKYDDAFPDIPAEGGCHYFFKFKVNDILLAIGRAMDLEPTFGGEEGDIMSIMGDGLSRELLAFKCNVDDYRGYPGDHIIYDQMTQTGPWYDLAYPQSPWSAPVYTKIITDSEKTPIRDLIAEIAEAIDYVAYFKEDEKPSPFKFFVKNDSTKQLNVILRSVLLSQNNNVIKARKPRSINRVKNYLTLRGGYYFREDIPNDRDGWTEDIGTYWIAVEGTVSRDTGDKAVGDASIKCETTGQQVGPEMKNLLANSPWGVNPFNPNSEGVDQLYWQWKNNSPTQAIYPRIKLYDDQDPVKMIYYDFSASTTWAGRQIGVGAANIGLWSGDTGDFNWNITEIRFDDLTAHTSLDTAIIRVDNLYFWKSGGYNQLYLQDSASITKYGKEPMELALPSAFPWINMKLWGDKVIQKYAKPLRILELTCLIDPATVKEDDDVTAAKLYPGWSVQAEIPRWKIKLVANGGVWWRILRTTYNWGDQGFSVGLNLIPVGAESPEDYSHISGSRILHRENPLAAFVNMLTKRGYG